MFSGGLSPNFDINSSTVRHVLRGWITHGNVAAVWMTQPLSSITISRLLETCQHANVVGCYAEFHSDTALHQLANRLVIRQVPVDLCEFGFPLKKRVTLFSGSRSSVFEAGATL